MRKFRSRRGQRGVAVVEFALVLPLFMLLVLGTIDFGYFLFVTEVVTNAAREGARAGSVVEPGQSAFARTTAGTAAQNYLTRGGLKAGGVVLSTGVIQGGAADAACTQDRAITSEDSVCVDVQYPVGSVTGFLARLMPTYAHAHALMRWQ